MSGTVDVTFLPTEAGYHQRLPYIDDAKPLEYTCNGKEGSLSFDGYYYIEDTEPTNEERAEWPHMYLPQTLQLHIHVVEQGSNRTVEKQAYVVEIYKRVKHESTNKISVIDDDGEPMNVCFFPTNKQTIYFHVLRTI